MAVENFQRYNLPDIAEIPAEPVQEQVKNSFS
jgi:hypothetical protein